MPIRILVVDDSVVIRKLLTTTLGEVPGLEVIATAALGRIALAKIAQLAPDLVILDVEMPELDGIATLKQIRKVAPRLPVILFCAESERGAAATIEALTCGASDYVAKPANAGNVLVAMQRVRDEMVPKIYALTSAARVSATQRMAIATSMLMPRIVTTRMPSVAAASALTGPAPAPPGAAPRPGATIASTVASQTQTIRMPAIRSPAKAATGPLVLDGPIRLARASGPRPAVEIVAIGASTGGPNALATVLTQLPAEFPVPIVIVQHMLATFTRHFAERLATQCRIQIVEANAGEALVAGRAYIARGDHHLLVERRTGRPSLVLNHGEVENFCRPAVDVLFRSVAQVYGAGVLALVLTGMGHDGLLGCGAIREAGGDVIVQDEASSVVWGMPGFVARAGLASQVMPLDQLGREVRRRVALGAYGGDGGP